MSLRISNVRTGIDEPEATLADRLRRVLGLPAGQPLRWRILRKALDARDSQRLQFVYTAEVTVEEDEATLARLARRKSQPARVERYHEEPFVMPPPGGEPLEQRPVVVGSGPG